MSAVVTLGFGPGASVPLVTLFGFVPGVASTVETPSTAGLRVYAALELPSFMGGIGLVQPELDVAAIIGTVAELGETVTINGTDIDAIVVVPYLGATLGAAEVAGRITRVYCAEEAFDDASGDLGSSAIVRGITYAIGRVERIDASLVRLELER